MLSDVIYTGSSVTVAPEQGWTELVRRVAAGDPRALETLYEHMGAPVFTLLVRTVKNRAAAEDLMLDVFAEIRLRAARYDPQGGSVVAWIMNVARCRANDPLLLHRNDDRYEHGGANDQPFDTARRERSLRGALSMLTTEERSTIEALVSRQGDAETAALLEAANGRTRIRSALGKLDLILHRAAGRRSPSRTRCERAETLPEHAARAVTPREAASLERHLAACADCRAEIADLRQVVDELASWGMDILSPPASIRRRLAQRIGAGDARSASPAAHAEHGWNPVAPGIQVKMLSADASTDRVSMLVRLAPGFAYPSHQHAGVEELHLLDGELWIDGCRLTAGDYNRAEPGSADRIVWSGTGCSCVLITSARDVLQ
ncbi:MAG TPA: cupin domain-containing protein [Gammaproteobacteria bacterium]|nr:cupin domain-containing protein [Gammaproteobacteria bacterium]